ncbi:hypothetical protein DH2020_002348 [Rehmannia glutinosa]|uniref:DUF4283 domain-containing protein n=1 Tax=Rehmannia glutinosa TaxID=99300 RepID=A0ABR0XTF3_REHGL
MPKYFEFDDMEIQTMPVWVQLPGLPVDFWNPIALSMVATKIGKPLTRIPYLCLKERISFQGSLVEVDASKELKRELRIRLPSGKRRMQQVLYEHEPKFCTKCKEIGHSTQGCTKENKAADRQPFKPRVRKLVAQNQPTKLMLKTPEPARVANNVEQTQPIKDKEPVEIIEEAQVQPSKEKQPAQTESESGHSPSFIYGYHTVGSRKPLWDDLISFGENCSLPWIAIGDFNNVLNANEKCNGKDVTSDELKHFEECCVLTGLTDLRSMGCNFTWTNNEVWCKLDRAMVNKHWFDQGLDGMANFLPSGCLSDHSPCIVSLLDVIANTNRPFRFFNMWASHTDFNDLVATNWNLYVRGTKQFMLCKKLKHLKRPLKELNNKHFSHISSRAVKAKEDLERAQLQLYDDPTNVDLQNFVATMRKQSMSLSEVERCFYYQKLSAST